MEVMKFPPWNCMWKITNYLNCRRNIMKLCIVWLKNSPISSQKKTLISNRKWKSLFWKTNCYESLWNMYVHVKIFSHLFIHGIIFWISLKVPPKSLSWIKPCWISFTPIPLVDFHKLRWQYFDPLLHFWQVYCITLCSIVNTLYLLANPLSSPCLST